MSRQKNALRGHFIAPIVDGQDDATAVVDWLELAKFIETIDADNNEETEDTGFYDGDGTKTTDVTGKAVGYSFSGFFDPEDPAQALVATKEFATGDAVKTWHKRVSADGLTSHVGKATLTGIIIGGGDATAYEAFECNVRWDQKPEEVTPVV